MRCQTDFLLGKLNLKHETHIYNLETILLKFERNSGIRKRIDLRLFFHLLFPSAVLRLLNSHFKKERKGGTVDGNDLISCIDPSLKVFFFILADTPDDFVRSNPRLSGRGI